MKRVVADGIDEVRLYVTESLIHGCSRTWQSNCVCRGLKNDLDKCSAAAPKTHVFITGKQSSPVSNNNSETEHCCDAIIIWEQNKQTCNIHVIENEDLSNNSGVIRS